jgi:peptide/nickel transport system substrate-binding protein
VTLTQPKDTSEVEAKLRTKKLDVAFVGRPQADKLKSKAELATLQEQTVGHSTFFGMRFFMQTAPFNDVRVRTALSLALDRRDMLQQFFAGSGEVNPWVSWPIKRWTLPQSELVTLAGYRPGSAGRAQDITDAKALLAAYVAEKPLPPTLNLYVLDDAERAIKMGSVMRDQLKQTLNLDVNVSLVNQTQMGTGLLDGSYAWAAAPDNGWVDLDDWVYPYFHSSGTKNTFPLRDADLDKVIESQRIELDANKRRDIGYDIQRKLLVLNPAVNFVSETLVSLAWPYVRDFPLDASDGYQHRFADCWIDKSQPDFKGR